MMKEYLFTLSFEDLNVINNALQDAPFKYAAPLIQKINKQIAQQENKDKQE